MKKISIVIPVYNSEKYLRRCIESLIKQTYEEIEILLVNDGSTDNSRTICEEYVRLDERVILINQSNGGVSKARNTGITHATGDYIMFVDSDDYVDTTICKKLVSKEADFVFCRYYSVLRNNKQSLQFPELRKIEKKSDIDNKLFEILYNNLLLNPPFCKLYKKELVITLFREELNLGEDLIFNFDYIKNCTSLSFVDEALYYYQIENTESLSRKFDYERIKKLYEVFQITSNQCKEIFKDNFEIELLKTNFLKEVCVSIKKLIVLKGSYSFFEKLKLIRKYCNEYNFGDFQTKQWDDEPLVYRIFFFFLKKKKILLLFLITILSEKIKMCILKFISI